MISLAGMGMLTTVGVVVSMDTFGPINDNMRASPRCPATSSRGGAEVLTSLDAVGNTTKAITKGVAIATAVLAATSLFGSFRQALLDAGVALENVDIPIEQPIVMVGLLIGGSVAFMFSAQAIRAVGRAAGRVVFEVRKQFREHPGIMDYTERPDYGAVVDICTRDSLRELLTPGCWPCWPRSPPRFLFEVGHPRCLPGRGDPDWAAPGGDAVGVRRRLGQRQEVRGGRPPRRQELRAPQGDRDRRHRRRPVPRTPPARP